MKKFVDWLDFQENVLMSNLEENIEKYLKENGIKQFEYGMKTTDKELIIKNTITNKQVVFSLHDGFGKSMKWNIDKLFGI